MGGKTDALVRVVFWLVLLLATGSVWVRDGRHFLMEREAAVAKMKAATAAAPQPVKVDAATEATTTPASGAGQAAGAAVDEEEEFDFFEEPAAAASAPASDADTSSVGAGKVHVQFCHGWSYAGNFRQVQQHFARRLPHVQVTGANYPAPTHLRLLAQATGAASMLGMVAIPFGDKIAGLLGVALPPFYAATVAPNKLTCFGALWVGNNLAQSMAQTGAFEVEVNGKTVFSKLAEGRMPRLEELDKQVVAALQ